ncbi:MAG: hypothetical protein ABR571_03700 [Jatrophihabitans sp.]|uniref:hypothetical protein n=1 Tax=Jatrophihabitans sp. TaxID=1932789 RepID=UPI00391014D3
MRQNGYETEACISIWADHKEGPNLSLRFTPRKALELSHALQLLLGRIEVGR